MLLTIQNVDCFNRENQVAIGKPKPEQKGIELLQLKPAVFCQ